MFTWRSITVGVTVASVAAATLVLLLATPVATAVFTGLGVGAVTAVMAAALRDGRFLGTLAASNARRTMVMANLIILGSALIGVTGLNVERELALSLKLLVLATGMAGFCLGSATAILDADESTGSA